MGVWPTDLFKTILSQLGGTPNYGDSAADTLRKIVDAVGGDSDYGDSPVDSLKKWLAAIGGEAEYDDTKEETLKKILEIYGGGGPTPPPPGPPLPDILWWEFLDGSGTDIGATVGTDGTTNASWVTGKTGSGFALEFNGATQSAASSNTVVYGTNTITICAWMWFDVLAGNLNFLTSAAPNGFTFLTSGASLYLVSYGDGASQRQSFAGFSTSSAWVHVAVVVSPTQTQLFVDAVELVLTTAFDNRTGTSNFASNTLNIPTTFNGRIDDLRIYSGDVSADLAAIMADAQ